MAPTCNKMELKVFPIIDQLRENCFAKHWLTKTSYCAEKPLGGNHHLTNLQYLPTLGHDVIPVGIERKDTFKINKRSHCRDLMTQRFVGSKSISIKFILIKLKNSFPSREYPFPGKIYPLLIFSSNSYLLHPISLILAFSLLIKTKVNTNPTHPCSRFPSPSFNHNCCQKYD